LADAGNSELIESSRIRVVWIGREVPDELSLVANVLGLTVETVRNIERIDIKAADLLALIVSAAGKDVDKALGRLLRLAKTMRVLDYGVLLGTASPDPANAYKLQSDLLRMTKLQISALGFTREDFSRTLRSHQPGPAVNPKLKSPLDGHDQNYDSADDYEPDSILLQRAFNGFNRISLTTQEGGFSKDCKVWRIDAYHETDPCEPFVAKAARRDDLQDEFETYCTFVRDSIPFPFRAPLLEARFIKGATRAILVSAFVGRSQRLDEYLATASSPELVMVSLFEGALGVWRRNATSVNISLGHFYVEQQKAAAGSNSTERKVNSLLPDPGGLIEAFEQSRLKEQELLTPSQMWDKLDNLPIKEHFICRVHGDLNIRNVFVRWNTIDTILIDFSNSGIRESLARDPTKLETSISLTCRDSKKELLSEVVLRQLYKSRLLPPRNFMKMDGRTDAIRQIRKHAGGEGIGSDEYEILTICHLLRFACTPIEKERDTVEMKDRRALSYSIACDLLRNL
jgi:hypothetical protein